MLSPRIDYNIILCGLILFFIIISVQAASFVSSVGEKLSGGKLSFVLLHVLVRLSLLIFMSDLTSKNMRIPKNASNNDVKPPTNPSSEVEGILRRKRHLATAVICN